MGCLDFLYRKSSSKSSKKRRGAKTGRGYSEIPGDDSDEDYNASAPPERVDGPARSSDIISAAKANGIDVFTGAESKAYNEFFERIDAHLRTCDAIIMVEQRRIEAATGALQTLIRSCGAGVNIPVQTRQLMARLGSTISSARTNITSASSSKDAFQRRRALVHTSVIQKTLCSSAAHARKSAPPGDKLIAEALKSMEEMAESHANMMADMNEAGEEIGDAVQEMGSYTISADDFFSSGPSGNGDEDVWSIINEMRAAIGVSAPAATEESEVHSPSEQQLSLPVVPQKPVGVTRQREASAAREEPGVELVV